MTAKTKDASHGRLNGDVCPQACEICAGFWTTRCTVERSETTSVEGRAKVKCQDWPRLRRPNDRAGALGHRHKSRLLFLRGENRSFFGGGKVRQASCQSPLPLSAPVRTSYITGLPTAVTKVTGQSADAWQAFHTFHTPFPHKSRSSNAAPLLAHKHAPAPTKHRNLGEPWP